METFQFTDAEHKLNAAFSAQGRSLWLVGGAVRDFLMGVECKDKDFATDATPDEQIAIYEAAGFRYIPTGLQHGTITAIVDGELFEVTTFRTESDHDGRYATMTFTRNIEDDLGRRDLTINAMALSFDNVLIDPFGGQADLEAKRVRFVGNADDRIREDYLRVLRWMRFHQRLANGTPFDPETVEAVKRNAAGLQGISVERIWGEMSKALTYPNALALFDLLDETEAGKYMGLTKGSYYWMTLVPEVTRDPVSIIAGYVRSSIELQATIWKWSSTETKQAMAIVKLLDRVLDPEVQRWLVAVDGYRPYDVAEAARMLGYPTDIETWAVPDFPVKGGDLIARGMKPGPEMGAALRRMREEWAKGGYQSSKSDLMTW